MGIFLEIIYAVPGLSLNESANIVGKNRESKRVHLGPVNLSDWSLANNSAASILLAQVIPDGGDKSIKKLFLSLLKKELLINN